MVIEPDASWLGPNRPRVVYEPINPAAWSRPEMRAALARRDVGAVYRILQKYGVSQRRIAALTAQSQSEISEILGGRRVASYDVLVRIADGLGVPRGWIGLGYVLPQEPDPLVGSTETSRGITP